MVEHIENENIYQIIDILKTNHNTKIVLKLKENLLFFFYNIEH